MKPPQDYPVGEKISIDVDFVDEDPGEVDRILQVAGGIKVTVDGYELTRYKQQEKLEHDHDQPYEYKGSHPEFVVGNMLDCVSEFAREEVDPTRLEHSTEKRVELYDAMGHIVISWLNEHAARIAFQVPSIGAPVTPAVPVHSEIGFAVRIEDLVQATVEVSDNLITYIEDSNVQKDKISDLEQMTNELRGFNSA